MRELITAVTTRAAEGVSMVRSVDWRTEALLLRWKVIGRLRRPRILRPQPYGILEIGTTRFPIDQITMRDGKVYFSGEKLNPFPSGLRGPATYQVYGEDGELVRVGRLPDSDFGISTSAMRWRFTVSVEFNPRDIPVSWL